MSVQVEFNDLRHYIEDYLRQRGLGLRKPFHCLSPAHPDVHPSMSYNIQAKNVHCFSCGVTYDIFDLIGLDYGINGFHEQVSKVCELFDSGVLVPALSDSDEYKRVNIPGTAVSDMPICTDESASYRYFLSRGITEDSCKKYGLYERDGRAYFPIKENGIETGWCARSIDDTIRPRYKNSSGPLGIWNSDWLFQESTDRYLFVTEGIIDAICLEQLGFCALSLCGSQNTRKLLDKCQVNLQRVQNWTFVCCGDPDDAGKKMNTALLEGFSSLGICCTFLPLEQTDGDVGSIYQRDRERLIKLIQDISETVTVDCCKSCAELVADFFSEVERKSKYSVASTGFPSLDKHLDGGFHSGLYVLGAISSLGKTSFALQIANYVAEHARDVLYFTLEQSRYELMAKCLSRISIQMASDNQDAWTVRQLLSGKHSCSLQGEQILQKACEDYSRSASSLYIVEGISDLGVMEIRSSVEKFFKRRGIAPMVIVDYLQILKPSDLRASDKQSVDRSVVELKRISRDFDIPVFVVSSFNRENYRTAVSMEAFKESGAVEYSSDVLLGLQLQGAGTKEFNVNAEKVREPRRVELVLLKNRNGIPYAKIPMRYYAKYSLFQEGRATKAVGSTR